MSYPSPSLGGSDGFFARSFVGPSPLYVPYLHCFFHHFEKIVACIQHDAIPRCDVIFFGGESCGFFSLVFVPDQAVLTVVFDLVFPLRRILHPSCLHVCVFFVRRHVLPSLSLCFFFFRRGCRLGPPRAPVLPFSPVPTRTRDQDGTVTVTRRHAARSERLHVRGADVRTSLHRAPMDTHHRRSHTTSGKRRGKKNRWGIFRRFFFLGWCGGRQAREGRKRGRSFFSYGGRKERCPFGRMRVARRMAVERGEPTRHAWREGMAWNERATLRIQRPYDIGPPFSMRLRATHAEEPGGTLSSSHVHTLRECIAHPSHQREGKVGG